MNRTEYIEMIHECAILPKSGYVPDTVPEELQVTYEGKRFFPVSYELSCGEDGKFIHIANIHEVSANSISRVLLEKVDKAKKI